MKKLIITSLILFAAFCAVGQKSSEIIKVGDAVPNFTVTMLDGSKIKIADLKGKTLLINFWATWCPPCRAEFKRVQKEIVDRFAKDDFVFIAISRGEKKETVAKFIKDNNYNFNIGLDPDSHIFNLFASTSIPRNYLIDRNGKVVAAEIGYSPELFEELINKISNTLKTK